jgi:hypothetical protein
MPDDCQAVIDVQNTIKKWGMLCAAYEAGNAESVQSGQYSSMASTTCSELASLRLQLPVPNRSAASASALNHRYPLESGLPLRLRPWGDRFLCQAGFW